MIARFRPATADAELPRLEPRSIGELLPAVLALRGIDLSADPAKDRRQQATNVARQQQPAASPSRERSAIGA